MFLSKPTQLRDEQRPLLATDEKEKLTRDITPGMSLVQVKPALFSLRDRPCAEAARAGALCTRAPRTVKLQLCCSVFSDHVTSNVFSSTANSGYILVRQSR